MNDQLSISKLRVALIISALLACVLFVANLLIGKNELFLLLNHNLGSAADFVFIIASELGTGWIFIPLLAYFLIYKRKYIPMLVVAFALSVLVPQLFKSLIMPHALRPTAAIADMMIIHVVEGVKLYKIHSFPSGHTTTAFTVFFLACLVINKRWSLPVWLMYALLVAYSRVYLAEHFPLDVAGGIVAAIASAMVAVWVQQRFVKEKTK